MLTPSEISTACERDHVGLANTREINRLFRHQDESNLWPINNRFNVTDRAIRAVSGYFVQMNEPRQGLAYCLALSAEISRIVNSEF